MRKLLVICGPTATGKTFLALYLAKVFNGEIVSADSRQVYKGMDIGTGKDIPKNLKIKKLKNFNLAKYYLVEGVRVWGYDLVGPKEEFSVAQYVEIARKIIKNILSRGKLPILVGGTGLYIKGVVDGIPTSLVPKNKKLRESLEKKEAEELFEILAGIDPNKAASMNLSDRRNPRRLIRAIEVASHKSKLNERPESTQSTTSMIRIIDAGNTDILFVGLTAPREFLYKRIDKRVRERLRLGLEQEIEKLLRQGVSWDSQAMQSLGYKQWRVYFDRPADSEVLKRNEETERKRAIEAWKLVEKQYAKRQMTWFRKDKRIEWFDVGKTGWRKDVEKIVRKWYKS
ncbi:MAG: tRNA (adenosine(37)-N6)-dimethylallyltransferase MiaA [Candidatus Jordarchaeaceae archaeon]